MRKTLLLFAVILLGVMAGKAQNAVNPSANDTSNYPYWIDMMQDPDANFFQTQHAFNIYWKDREITRSHGWKVFKRWEYMMQSRVLPDGSRRAPDEIFNAYSAFKRSARSATGSWVSMGPADIPAPGPAGYEGLGRLNVVAFHPSDPNRIYVGAPAGGMWQSTDGGNSWATHTDTLPTLGVSAILVDYSNPDKILIGTGDRDAGDAPGLGIFKSMNGGLSWAPSTTGMGNKTVGRLIQHPANALIMLAATNGGVYRSTDGGTTWTSAQSGNFKDIHFKPDNPDIVYAAAGADFYRSINNGTSFVKISNGLTSGQRGVIAVTAANPDYVYFMQSNSSSGFKGLYRSTDAGLTFTTRSTAPNIMDWSCNGSATGGQGWYDLALASDPLNAETIYAGGVNVWKSTNGGTTWVINSHWYGGCSVPAVHADCHFLGFSPVDGKLYAGNDGGCYVSADGGTSWTDRTVGMTIGQIYKLGQSATVRDKVINGFQDNGTYTFTPTGWVATGGGDGMECAVDWGNPIFTYHTIYYGDIYRKNNNAGEAHIAGNGVNGITESGGWVTPFCLSRADRKGMFVGYKNIWRSSNVTAYPVNWVKISTSLAGSNSSNMTVVEHSSANTNIFYAARSDNKLFRSDNCLGSNPTWFDLSSFLPASGTPTDIQSHPADENIVYITQGNGVYKSTNKGVTWTNITGNLPAIQKNTIAYYRNAPEGLYVGTDAGVYYKDQSMTSWLQFSAGLPANGQITELEIYYDNDSVARDAIRASTYGRGLWGSDMYHAMPSADFVADHTSVPMGCAVDFKDSSTGVPTFFRWEFQGGTPATSNLKNPMDIVYNTPGTYEVKLKVWNEFGADSITKTNYITVNTTSLPVVDFTADQFVLCGNDVVYFTDKSTNCPSGWVWNFNPNTVSFVAGTSYTSQNPIVLFEAPGSYDVQLVCSNALGVETLTRLDYIVKDGYALPFIETFGYGFDSNHWQIMNPDLGITWDTITVGGITPGSKAVFMDFFNYSILGRRDQLISPALNLTGYSSVTLSFKHAYEQRVRKDSLIIRVSDDCGLTWQRIWGMGPDGTPDVFVTHPSTDSAFYPKSADDWCGGSYGTGCYALDLSTFAGKQNIKLMFESYNRFGNNLFLSDVQVNGPVGEAELPLNNPVISIFPNPSQGQFTISINNGRGPVKLEILNPQGQALYRDDLLWQSGQTLKQLDLSGFAKGIYLLKLTGEQTSGVEKIVIK
ncbi:MAG: PKD domain-containing protein [Bacteroidales bacterium]|nr:PKD domain-containing protein [Bacteroidales bacterium]